VGGAGTLVGVYPVRAVRPVTRLGCWLTGSLAADQGEPVLEQIGVLAAAAERAGFDSFWVTDRTAAGAPGTGSPELAGSTEVPGSTEREGLEAYSLLGALATRTRTLHLGAVPLGVEARPPSIVAKIVTGIDVISHGRAILTFGMASTGDGDERRVVEALRVGRAMLEEESPTFTGSVYAIDRAFNRPRPVQAGGVPLVVVAPDGNGGAGLVPAALTGVADAVIVRTGIDDLRAVISEVGATVPDDDHGMRPTRLGVIGVVGVVGAVVGSTVAGAPEWLPDSGSALEVDRKLEVDRTAEAARAVLGAGADGCLVTIGLDMRPDDLVRIGAELADRDDLDAPVP